MFPVSYVWIPPLATRGNGEKRIRRALARVPGSVLVLRNSLQL